MIETIFPAFLALRALRSGAYKNTAYALAELIDNSCDAKGKQIAVVLMIENSEKQPHSIAVLDDGKGMNSGLLRKCIQYGYAEPINKNNPKNLGRFGVGLVASSLSQCTHLEVISWQKGEVKEGSALSTEVKISDKPSEEDNILPEPKLKELPEWTSNAFHGMANPISKLESGTLVVWRDVTPTWKRAKTLQENLSELCGRIYRTFIQHNQLKIVISVFNESTECVEETQEVEAVDPMFLKNWGHEALSKWDFVGKDTLFQAYTGLTGDSGENQYGENESELYTVKNGDQEIGEYLLTASYRREKIVRDPKYTDSFSDPGSAPYGKLAKKLRGVSILRHGREIELESAWLRTDNTVDRWISVSLDFDHDLDEIFGVSNDKQSAKRLSEISSMDIDDIKERIQFLEKESSDEFEAIECLRAAYRIKDLLKRMQRIVKEQRRGERTKEDPLKNGTRDPSYAPTAELNETGSNISKDGIFLPLDTKKPSDDPEGTKSVYIDTTSDGQPAENTRPEVVIKNELKVDCVTDLHIQSQAFFSAIMGPGHMVIRLHGQHSVRDALAKLLTENDSDADEGVITESGVWAG